MKTPLSQFAGQYQEWEPNLALRDHIACVWENDLRHASASEYYVAPDGCVDILWTGENLCVAGPDTHSILERTQSATRIVGIRFLPGAAHPWLGVPLSALLNSRVPLTEFWKEAAGILADRLFAADGAAVPAILEQALLNRLPSVGEADREIAFLRRCAAEMNRGLDAGNVRELSHRIGVSERTLLRRSTRAFGYGFKTLARILRFRRLFRLAMIFPDPNLADLAVNAEFADQAHMSREVQRLCGMTPAEFVAAFRVRRFGRFVQDNGVVSQ